jgi:hypothetical protein
MSIRQILGKFKNFESENQNLKRIIELESSNKKLFENKLKYKVRGSEQFQREKRNNENYRFFGKIELLNSFDLSKDFDAKPKESDLSLIDNSFKSFISVPVKFKGGKGLKKLGEYFNGKKFLDINLENGLPAYEFNSADVNKLKKATFLCFLNHNFEIGDLAKINFKESENSSFEEKGTFKVIDVEKNIIVLSTPPLNLEEKFDITDLTKIKKVTENDIGGIDFLKNLENLNLSNAEIIKNKSPKIYIQKVKNGEPLEYYIRVLKNVQNINNIFPAAFSKNIYNQQIALFNTTETIKRDNYLDNLDRPITKFYFSILKQQKNENFFHSSIESNFQNFIENTFQGEGLEDFDEDANNEPALNQVFLDRLIEYDKTELQEYQVNKIFHTFHFKASKDDRNELKYFYNPFYEVPVRKFSTYIETGQDNDVVNIPNYAEFDERYGAYRWRDILDVGAFEANGNGIDYPFLNNHFYIYFNKIITIFNQNSSKYNFFDGSLISTEFTNNIFENFINPNGNQKEDKILLKEFSNKKPC